MTERDKIAAKIRVLHSASRRERPVDAGGGMRYGQLV